MAEIEVEEAIDEIVLARYKRMAIDAQRDHFPQHIYGDQSHIEVLAKALEHCVEALEEDTAMEKVDEANGKIEALEGKIDTARLYAENARKELARLLDEVAV